MDRRQEIISELYNSKELSEALQKMNPPELRKDLKQELFVVICKMDAEKLFELQSRNELRYYTVRIMLNLIRSKTSTFYYQFRKHLEIIISSNFQLTRDSEKYENNEYTLSKNLFKVWSCDRQPDEDLTKEYEDNHIDLINTIKGKQESLSWYEQDLFNLYIEKNKNASVLSRETGIPKRSIYHTIKGIKKKLR